MGAVLATMMGTIMTISSKADSSVTINESNFPDSSFRQLISDSYDTDSDGVLSTSEINAATKLVVGGSVEYSVTNDELNKYTNVTGIEYLTNLQELQIGYTNPYETRYSLPISSIDLSHNTKLQKLTLLSNVTSIDLSNNTAITNLEICSDAIRTIDITDLKKLKKLSFINCIKLTDIAMYTVDTVSDTGYYMGADDSDVPGTFYGCGRLNTITFEGNAPKFEKYAFSDPIISATVYYPKGNKTWKKVIKNNYGGLINWKAYNTSNGKISDSQNSKIRPAIATNLKFYVNDEGVFKAVKGGKKLRFIKPISDEGKSTSYLFIPEYVVIGGYNYPVVEIKDNALKGYKSVEEIYWSANITKANKKTFAGLNKSKTITFRITAKNKKAFNKQKKLINKYYSGKKKFKYVKKNK